MFKNLRNSHSPTDSPQGAPTNDAVFIGWQAGSEGSVFPLYNITAPGHPSHGSTVSDKTLQEMKIAIPQTPSFRTGNEFS